LADSAIKLPDWTPRMRPGRSQAESGWKPNFQRRNCAWRLQL